MPGLFDDLIPQQPKPQAGLFDDLIPQQPAAAPAPVNQGLDAPTYVTQRADRGLADALGAPVDLLTLALNGIAKGMDLGAGVFGGSMPYRIKEPVGGSDWIANVASGANSAVGGTVVPPEAVSPGVRTAGELARGAGAALPMSMGLASAPVQEAAAALKGGNIASRTAQGLTKPYASGAGATIARDAVAGAGAGGAAGAYDEYAPDAVKDSSFGPIAKMLLALAGGVGGVGLESVVEGGLTGAKNLGRNMVFGKGDPNAPVSPATGQPYSRTEMDQAARIAQAMPTNKAQTLANIEQGQKDFGEFARPSEMPTTGMLADDIGMASYENVLRNRNPVAFIERDNARKALAASKVDQTAPADAEGRNFTNEATRQYDETLNTARKGVSDAEAAQAAAKNDVASQNADLEAYRARQPQASAAMAEDFNAARAEARGQKNAAYDAVPDAAPVENGREFLGEAVKRIDAEMPQMERAAGGAYADIAGRVRGRLADEAPITYGDLKALRAQISEARKAAVSASGQSAAGSGADVQRLDQLGQVVNHMTDQINPEAARFYREEYAPRFKEGRAGEYGANVDRAVRTGGESSATRPSEFGDKFLRKPEDAASLKRAMEPLPAGNEQPRLPGVAGESASAPSGLNPENVRDWMLGDLAKSGVLTNNAEIRYDKFRQWADRNRGVIDQFPDLANEVNGELARAQRGGALSKQLAADVASAKQNMQNTEQGLRRSVLHLADGRVFNPENAVGNIMGSGDPEKRMTEMVAHLKGNQDALDGLKAATRDWIKQKAGTTSAIVGEGGTREISRANLDKLFNQNEATLSKLYSPEEMNVLRQAHKLLDAGAKLNVRATSGSNTADKMMAQQNATFDQNKRLLEAALSVKYGVLVGGGIIRKINMFLQTLPDKKAGLEDILFQMQFDPELAKHLLTRTVKDVDSPAWNARLNALLAGATGGRESGEEKPAPLELTVRPSDKKQ